MEDEQPPQDADLRRSEPDAVGVVHEDQHPLREPRELLVEGLDLVGAHPQHRIAVLADLRQRDLPPRLALRLLGVLLVAVVIVIVVIVIVVVVVVRRGRVGSSRRV